MTGTELFGVLQLVDPLAAIEVSFATGPTSWSFGVAAVLLVGFWAALGRAFCGWLCPLGLVLDLVDSIRCRFLDEEKDNLTPRHWKYRTLLLVFIWSLLSGLPIFATVSPINILVWSTLFGVGPELVVLGAVLVGDVFSRRLWCRSLCPLGAFYSLIGRFGVFRIKVVKDHSTTPPCQRCSRTCSMGIDVASNYSGINAPSISDPECTRCGDCVDVCPREFLATGVSFEV